MKPTIDFIGEVCKFAATLENENKYIFDCSSNVKLASELHREMQKRKLMPWQKNQQATETPS